MLVTSTQGHRGGDAVDKWDSVMADSSIDPNGIALCLPCPFPLGRKPRESERSLCTAVGNGTYKPAAEFLEDCLLLL